MLTAVIAAQDFKTKTGHGKLLLDDSLYPLAYATNVNEQVCHFSSSNSHISLGAAPASLKATLTLNPEP